MGNLSLNSEQNKYDVVGVLMGRSRMGGRVPKKILIFKLVTPSPANNI